MTKTIGTICVTAALLLDTASYWRQISKILRTKKSAQVSSTAFLYKIVKIMFSTIGLVIYRNFVGVVMEVWMLTVYIISLIIICRYKPKGWNLWK